MKKLPDTLSDPERWLSILVKTYLHTPNAALANVILYYVDKIILDTDFNLSAQQMCLFHKMRKFWLWQVQIH